MFKIHMEEMVVEYSKKVGNNQDKNIKLLEETLVSRNNLK